MPITTPDPLLKAHEAAEMLRVSEPTFWRHVKSGVFPRALKLGGSSRWPASEILAFIEKVKAARDAG